MSSRIYTNIHHQLLFSFVAAGQRLPQFYAEKRPRTFEEAFLLFVFESEELPLVKIWAEGLLLAKKVTWEASGKL